jgi:hypothetical protein
MKDNINKFHIKEVILYWIFFIIPFILFFVVLSYRIDIFNLYKQRYPPDFKDQLLFLEWFKNILLSHRISSVIWCGSLCFIFFTSYTNTKKLNRKIHKLIGWIMVVSILLNIFSGLILMYIKTKNDTKAQNYGLIIAAFYSFISQFLLIFNIIICPNRKHHELFAIRLVVAPLSALFQHVFYLIFIQYKSNFSSIWFIWDFSIIISGFISIITIEYYIWKVNKIL